MSAGTFMTQREAELRAGRERVQERLDRSDDKHKRNMRDRFKSADEERVQDEERRERILNAPGIADKATLDRAGAEIVDQAQTQLEAVGHLYDRQEKVTTAGQQWELEALEGHADPEGATELTEDAVTAQAVNQPTVLANNAGIPTEDRALNVTGLRSVEPLPVPEERHVPKTRKRAEQIAKAKVPPAERVVKPGWHGDRNEEVSGATKENREVALEVVEEADPVALNANVDADIERLLS